MAAPDPYSSLWPPLRFAARDRLGVLRDLARLVDGVLLRAGAAGPAAARAQEAARRFDAAAPVARDEALGALIEALGALCPVPEELAGIGRATAKPGPVAARRGTEPSGEAEGRGRTSAVPAAAKAGAPRGSAAQVQIAPSAPARASDAAAHRGSAAQVQIAPSAPARASDAAMPRRSAVEASGAAAEAEAAVVPAVAAHAEAAVAPARGRRRATASKAAATPAPRKPARAPSAPDAEADGPVLPGPSFTRGPLAAPLPKVPGVGPRTLEWLAKKGLSRLGHVLFHLPRDWQDRRRVATIRELEAGQPGLTVGEVVQVTEAFQPKMRRRILRVVLSDGSGRLALTFFHYWPATLKRFQPGRSFYAWGEVKLFGGQKQIVHPEVDDADGEEQDASLDRGRIVPIYPGVAELGQGRYRLLVRRVLDASRGLVPEVLPEEVRRARDLPGIEAALELQHFPPAATLLPRLLAGEDEGRRRLVYEELFVLSVALALKQRGVQVEPGHAFRAGEQELQAALRLLPFPPTGAQLRALRAIAADMARPEPMNRLLQGDVGAGKTAVAVVAAALAANDGRQVAVMAPTELLVEQHAATFERLLGPAGLRIAVVAAGRGAKAVEAARAALASGVAQIGIGTHALFEESSGFRELGLAIVDEQHRFGVLQRARLFAKGRRPDVLVMTATPIPRTLALVLHGELSHTVIDELPPGRTPITTRIFEGKKCDDAWALVGRELAAGRQAYVVFPLVEESERSELADATSGLQELRQRFPGVRAELVHGRLAAEEKERVMGAFRAGEVRLLVATTVVEVGVDVPNASVMVVEHAERFGLSQLHQLRGRVGRGAAKSHCLLLSRGGRGEKAAARLAILAQTQDGFRIAEEDLQLRGPGEFLGTKQAGLPELAFAELSRDARILEEARADAFALVAADPTLAGAGVARLREEVFSRYQERMSLARVG